MSERSITAIEEFRRDNLPGSSAAESQSSNEMLGAVPIPSEDARCTALSVRSGKRCQRYRQAGSSVCSKHASSGSNLLGKHASSPVQAAGNNSDIPRVGFGKPTAEPDTDTWAWTEDEWQARFDAVNDWVYSQLPVTNPALSERLWQFLAQAETELMPEQTFELARWFGDVVQGAALVAAEEGLTLTG
jgi:hypothetical protein